MRRSAFQSVTALVALLAASACTQDFDQFEPDLFPGPSGSGSGGASSSGGAGGGQTAAGSTTSSSSSSGGADGGERCSNGEDDDGDGAVDCADGDCGGFACVAVPEGWQGPGLLYQGPEAADVACPEGFSERVDVGGRDPLDTPATCSPCACGAPAVECAMPAVTVYTRGACGGGSATLRVQTENCINIGGDVEVGSYSGEVPDVDSATCAPSGGEATLPPPRFGIEGLVCAPGSDAGGCEAGEACAPREIDAPFEQGVCVWRDGERSCPEGFGERHVFASSMADNRGCTRCTCNADGVRCAATATLFGQSRCRGAGETVPFNGACVDDPPPASVSIEVTGSGSCQPRGGDPSGEVEEGGDRITVCCAR
ncbi:hypothetical protein [Sorangium cellulosum]|uniref:hypothetical protein n=1 Tax=Sorangium cellulosum TaxID=56 RepID=UPI0012FFA398|nr:hypothetical protein [Sorangium cellulosum]